MKPICLVATLCSALLAACSNHTNSILVDETHLQIGHTPRPNSVFWLDDKTLVFRGIDNGPEPTESSDVRYAQIAWNEAKARTYVWTLGKKPRVYRPDLSDGERPHLCAAKGKIYYSTSARLDQSSAVMEWDGMAGLLGKEQLVHFKFDLSGEGPWFPSTGVGNRDLSRIDRPCEQVFSAEMAGHVWRPSWQGNTLLDLGLATEWKKGQFQPIVIREISGARVIPVEGISPSEAAGRVCAYATMWEDAFFVYRCNLYNPRKEIAPVWKVYTDARTERTNLDFTKLVTNEPLPFRDGYFVATLETWNTDNTSSLDGWGTYIWTQTGWKRVVGPGYQFLALSPDGCRAAFAARVQSTILSHLTVYDLCKAAKP